MNVENYEEGKGYSERGRIVDGEEKYNGFEDDGRGWLEEKDDKIEGEKKMIKMRKEEGTMMKEKIVRKNEGRRKR